MIEVTFETVDGFQELSFSNNRFGQLRFHRALRQIAANTQDAGSVTSLFSSSFDHPNENGFDEDFEISDWVDAAMSREEIK